MTHILLREVSILGRIDKGVKCSVSGCGREAVRSLSTEKVRSAGLNVGSNERRAYLCKEHYKEYKKKTKKDKQLEKWRYSG
jgi:thymidine kinase